MFFLKPHDCIPLEDVLSHYGKAAFLDAVLSRIMIVLKTLTSHLCGVTSLYVTPCFEDNIKRQLEAIEMAIENRPEIDHHTIVMYLQKMNQICTVARPFKPRFFSERREANPIAELYNQLIKENEITLSTVQTLMVVCDECEQPIAPSAPCAV